MKALYFLLSFFSRTANIIAFLLLLISISAAYINPDYFWPIALFGLAYPVLLALNIFFMTSWIFRRRWFFLLSFLGIVLSYPQLKGQIAMNFLEAEASEKPGFRVMSFNVRNFDLYNWTKSSVASSSMLDTIGKYQADVLLLQEYYTDTNRFKNKEKLMALGYQYHVEAIELVKNGHRKWGVALFSKHPIRESGELIRQQLPSPYGFFPNRGVYADVEIAGKTYRFISVHLQSVHLGDEDYAAIRELQEEQPQPNKFDKYIRIARKLAIAFMQRGIQATELADKVENSPYPVILGGDFNDTPSSFTYNRLTQKLKDSFLQAGKGVGATYNGIIPLLRIDYILTDPSLHCTHFEINPIPYSDHFPIVADLSVRE
jgi:endonuclease/exonuclease/phosphatase family metal-dependent hydrolase